MANLFRRACAEPIIRRAAESKVEPDADWYCRVEDLSQLVEYRVSATCVTMLGTAMLAKALNPDVNLYWFKPTHVSPAEQARSYSARTLCHTVLVPLAAEYGFSLGVSGREPLNNQPFFRMERLDDGTPVNPKAKRAVEYLLELVEMLQSASSEEAERALHAFIDVRRKYVATYSDARETAISSPAQLIKSVGEFMRLGSAGGSHAQAIAAAVMDAALGPERVESGRINDPSRHYPGDVCIWTSPERERVARAIEVRDKPVSPSDIHIFARRCQAEGVPDCGVLMVSPGQSALDKSALREWADALGLNLRLWLGWDDFIREALFWAETDSRAATITATERARARLTEAEVSAEALEGWDALTCKDAPALRGAYAAYCPAATSYSP